MKTVAPSVVQRLLEVSRGKSVVWLDDTWLHSDPKDWPVCDVLWTLWSSDLPLRNIKAYVQRIKPVELNSVSGLEALQDRRYMLRQCLKWGIPVPDHIECSRDDGTEDPDVQENMDFIIVDGVRMDKPFVEKPVAANRDDIYVYYPQSLGGGRARLGPGGRDWDTASEDRGGRGEIRRDDSYIYSRFVPSEGFDMRLLGVGSRYAHAEARYVFLEGEPGTDMHSTTTTSSSSLTGWSPVVLESEEKSLAERAWLAFRQASFSVLMSRAQQVDQRRSGTFVHELEVKNGGLPRAASKSLIDDIAQALSQEIRQGLDALKFSRGAGAGASGGKRRATTGEAPEETAAIGSIAEAVIAAAAAAGRAPPERIDTAASLFCADGPGDSPPLSPQDLPNCLQRVATWHAPYRRKSLTEAVEQDANVDEGMEEDPLSGIPEEEDMEGSMREQTSRRSIDEDSELADAREVKPQPTAVLAVLRHGDRTPKQKLKFKLSVAENVADSRFCLGLMCGWLVGPEVDPVQLMAAQASKHELRAPPQMRRLRAMLRALASGGGDCASEKGQSQGGGADAAAACCAKARTLFKEVGPKDRGLLIAACEVLSPTASQAGTLHLLHAKVEAEEKVLKIVVKWGGELTALGEQQAQELGKHFRQEVYPNEDVTHMHATLRHDLKVYASSDARCMETAAGFAQGLLRLQASRAAVQVSFVRLDDLGRLNQEPFQHSPLVEVAKASSKALLESGRPVDAVFEEEVLCQPGHYKEAFESLEAHRASGCTVREALEACAVDVKKLVKSLGVATEATREAQGGGAQSPGLQETLLLAQERWAEFAKDMKGEPPMASSESVPDILDNVIFDLRHTLPVLRASGGSDSCTSACGAACEAFQKVHATTARIAAYAEIGKYGMTKEDKFEIARKFLRPMLRKLRWDLRVASGRELGEESHHLVKHQDLYKLAARSVEGCPAEAPMRSRLYFAHNSQMHTLVNLFRWAPRSRDFIDEAGAAFLAQMSLPLGYICHFIIKLWKGDLVSLELSPGDQGSCSEGQVPPSAVIGQGIRLSDFDDFLSEALEERTAASLDSGADAPAAA